jgi:hypothetical protein
VPPQKYAPPQSGGEVLRDAVPGQKFVPSGRGYGSDSESPAQNSGRVPPKPAVAPDGAEWEYAPTQRYYPPVTE